MCNGPLQAIRAIYDNPLTEKHWVCCESHSLTEKEDLFPDELAASAQSLCCTSHDLLSASSSLLKRDVVPSTWNWFLLAAETAGAAMPPREPVNVWRLVPAAPVAVAAPVVVVAGGRSVSEMVEGLKLVVVTTA